METMMLDTYSMQRLGRLFPDLYVNVEMTYDFLPGDSIGGTFFTETRRPECRISVGDKDDTLPEFNVTLHEPFDFDEIEETVLGLIFSMKAHRDKHFPTRRTSYVKQWHVWDLGADQIVWVEKVVKHEPSFPYITGIGNLVSYENETPVHDRLY